MYSIVAEPLATTILEDDNITGINIGIDKTCKIAQFADDINIFVKTGKDIDRVLEHLKSYQLASGAEVNMAKSECTFFGSSIINIGKWGFKCVNKPRKVLGIYIGKDEREAEAQTWRETIAKVKNVLNMWSLRGLKLRGKVIVTNALFFSKVQHVLATCSLPNWVQIDLNELVNNFLWNSKATAIAHDVLINVVEKGGLNLADLSCKKRGSEDQTCN